MYPDKDDCFTLAVDFATDAEKLYLVLLQVDKWWPGQFEGASAKVGDEFILRNGEDHFSRQRVAEATPSHRVKWEVIESWRKQDAHTWNGTTMTFDLSPRGKDCTLTLTHVGRVPKGELDRCIQGWTTLLSECVGAAACSRADMRQEPR
ncbi:MAG: SRPBCC domain-containing protein [Opitutaceae bacterium]|nr:SRPBCC domain-containing protein [Opitutaceae bacterium]